MAAFDVIIAGVGAAGSAAACHLARRGARVLALDRHSIPNDRSSHSGTTRIIRQAYFEHPDYVPLLLRAYEHWRQLEITSRQPLMFLPGMLYSGPRDGPLVQGCLAASRRQSLNVETLDSGDAMAMFPGFSLPPDHGVLFEPAGGYVLADAAIRTHASQAAAHGAILSECEPLLQWGASRTSVWVQTPKARYEAGALVLATGAWMSQVSRLSIKLTATLQTLVWTEPRQPSAFASPKAPVWAISDDDGSMYYGFPSGAGGPGLKAARHHPGVEFDPEMSERPVPQGDIAQVMRFLGRRLPGACGPVTRTAACIYTSTVDQHFVLDRHPDHSRVIVSSACSGHGFKFAPVIGEAIADLCLGDRSPLPIEFLSLSRFGETGAT